MLDQRTRSLMILARLEAALGAVVAVAMFALYELSPRLLGDQTLALTVAVLGATAAVYFATLHLVLKRGRPVLSTFVLSVITLLNAILIIISTGGLDSPFYSLWLLAIVVAGIFGLGGTVALMGLTVVYYAFFILSAPKGTHILENVIQFGITLAAAGLAEWMHRRSRSASVATTKLQTLSGQLTAEQLKADAIMSSIAEGVMVIDGLRKIQLFNKSAQELTGWDEASAQNIGYNLVMQLRTADDQPMNDLNDPFVEAWKKQSEVVRDDLVATTRNGRKVQLNISISPIFDASHVPTGAIALFRDISEEKEVARQKEEFVSTASHEMRTPVAAIEGYISLAMNNNVATIDDRALKYLEKAHDTIVHLGQLFRDLLSVTKAEEGQLSGRLEAVNLAQLAQSSVDDMQFSIKKNITLVYQIGEQPGKVIAPLYYVAANPERLREVIMNLIDNAYKFTNEGGIKVSLDGNEKEVTISVSDSGVGIAAEDISHLFQKFYRIDSTATRTIGGTGLGLYLCRRLIESFSGRIWVESKPGEGSTFKFTLPRLTEVEIAKLHVATGNAAPAAAAATAQALPPPAPAAIAMPIPTIDEVDSGTIIGAAPIPAARANDDGLSRRIQ